MNKVIITIGNDSIGAELNTSPTAQQIFETLPVEGNVNRWGDEIYFDIPVSIDLAPDARADVQVGDLAYWPTGSAFCIFFGPTPVSTGKTPRAYSPVNVFGKITQATDWLKSVSDGENVRVIAAW